MHEDLVTAWVDYSIERGPVFGSLGKQIGLRLRVKAKPEIEDFMRTSSNGKTSGVEAYGDGWLPLLLDESSALEVYTVDIPNGRGYTFNKVGAPLLIEGTKNRYALDVEDPAKIINLSFLALVGISSERGVCFGIPGMYSAHYIKNLHNSMHAEIIRFLQDYVVPITMNLQIVNRV